MAKFGTKRKEFPPFGVMYLASVIEKAGHKVKLFKISRENTKINFRDFEIVGFSMPSSVTYPLVKECRFKSMFKDGSLILAGGVHASIYPVQTLDDLRADIL